MVPTDTEENLIEIVDDLLSHDLNINAVLGLLFVWIRVTHKKMDEGRFTMEEAHAYLKVWETLDSFLGLGDATVTVPAEVQALLDQRAAARQAKDFAKSDELRKALESLGWKVKDTAKGQELLAG